MNALQKAKIIQELRAAIAEARMASPLNKAKKLKEIGQLREKLSLKPASNKNTATPRLIRGRNNNVKTAKGTRVSTVLAVTEIDNVIASHTQAGTQNPNYPQELQPRDRSRDSSQAWVQKVSRDLDPESLGRSGRADSGAPIVGDDMAVESGNGRTMAIAMAYENGDANEYRQWLLDEADYLGFDQERLAGFKHPILIRIRTSEVDREQFAIEANQDDKLSYSATERAKTDAKRLDNNMLQLFEPDKNGDLTAQSNQRFITAFLQKLGDTEAAQYMTKDGKPTQALVARMKAAIFSKAYNDERLTEMMADQAKPELQNILNALGVAAPKFIEAQAFSRGDVQDVSSALVDSIDQSLDKQVTNAIIDATNVVMKAKRDNQAVAEYVKQLGLFEDLGEGVAEIAVFIASNNRSAKKMGLFFKSMAEFAEIEARRNTVEELFGEPPPVSTKDAANYAVQKVQEYYGNEKRLDMFDSITSPLERAKKIKELREAIAEAKQSSKLQKARLIQKILGIRQDLGLVAQEQKPNSLSEQLKIFTEQIETGGWDLVDFNIGQFVALAKEIDASSDDDLKRAVSDISKEYKDALISFAIEQIK